MCQTLRICVLLAVLGMLGTPATRAQTASISGRVTDAVDGGPLAGANVLLLQGGGMVTGTATDVDGRYRIAGVASGSYTLRVRFVGYQEAEVPVTLAAGENATVDVGLTQAGFELNTVIVTASRRAEKVLDAPASISVLTAREVEQSVGTNAVEALRNTTGVDMAQTGVDRREMVLRGFNNAFSGATYVLTDYRQAAVPSLGVNVYSIMPNLNIDLDRVEVVRGPGSALYGPGVDAGVVHFITKDPFTHPGTTISVSGGERSFFGIQGRHAGVLAAGRLGYKVTGAYSQAEDWELDPNDPIDRVQIETDGVRNNDYEKLNLNGTLEFRPNDRVSITANGGFSSLKATVLSGIGTVQADGFGYSYGQLRLQVDRFFVQVYVNKNDAGDSFVYDASAPDNIGTRVVDKGLLFNAQAQYDFEFADGREQLIVGVDLELTRPDTDGTILGRNDENDNIDEYGVYAQSTTAISPKLDLVLAARGDYNNVVETFQVSPRAGLVFKPTPSHTVRATYNRAFSSPGTNSLFLDIVAGQLPGTNIIIRGRGAASGFTWERNPAFAGLPTPDGSPLGSDLVASSLNPAALGLPQPVGLSLEATYAALYQGLAAIPPAQLAAMLQAQGIPIDAQTAAALVALLNPQLTQVQGFTRGRLGKLNLSTLGFDPVSDLTDIKPLDQTITQTVEVGYKGILGERVLFAVDGYWAQKEDFVGPLAMETPFVFVPTLAGDLTVALAGGIQNNVQLAGALAQMGISPQAAAALIVGLAGSQLPGANTPVAIVQARENNPGPGNTPELMLSYRNFGKITYWGFDAAVQVMATRELGFFGNVSFVSDDFFDNEELDEANTDLSVALNAPKFKFKAGANYDGASGFSAGLAARYSDGFPVRSGPYQGMVDSYFLLDLNLGYAFRGELQGLRFDVGINNVLDNEHREFIGAPKLGRMGIARLTYTF
ncbi:TonB-dependent receptor [Rhodocaloribacter litoris]|uniref:TonB-dependent receptor n=1 Tax=Rhodocaloribacter litoris TaxID=2558931 RepID=UPI00141E51D3|nr:TonB-dependent receptor [Rhodocaloribacter litoris]QXD15609.1 TonB-dependent receptor [Rhodocaloribacter litoris]